MINTMNIPKAYSEVYSFINALGLEYKEKIPNRIYEVIKEQRDKECVVTLHKDQEITQGMLSHEALALIAALNLQYWCTDNEEKQRLKQAYMLNTEKENEKYSYDNMFSHKGKSEDEEVENNLKENMQLIEYKEGIFKRIFKLIRRIFKRS